MNARCIYVLAVLSGITLVPVWTINAAQTQDRDKPPAKVYVPYKELTDVFEKEQQGVFLPYNEFQKLWRAAQGRPEAVMGAPFEFLISTARLSGSVKEQVAAFRLELTLDVLADGWVQVPLGLSEVAVAEAKFLDVDSARSAPLLRVANGQYTFVTKGRGRYVLALDFVRQLETQPGLAVLKYRIPAAAITTLELLIPQENLKVDVQPMLAATTSQVEVEGAKATRLQAFLGSATEVNLSWKPKAEAAEELKPVVVCEQLEHIHIGEALVSHQVTLNYTIHRGRVDAFSLQLPRQFRVSDLSGQNIAKWDIEAPNEPTRNQVLKVALFSPAEQKYSLTVKMERFLQEAQSREGSVAPGERIALSPIVTERALRQTGLIGITCSPRRSVRLDEIKNLGRVDTGQLPAHLQNQPGATAYRFITSDYGATMVIETTSPRITVDQRWMLGVESDRLRLLGRLTYKVERTGIFELNMGLPEPWQIETVGPAELVDDYQLTGQGPTRTLHILLKKEMTGNFVLTLTARAERTQPQPREVRLGTAGAESLLPGEPVNFPLPLPEAKDPSVGPEGCRTEGQLVLLLAEQLQAQVQQVNQLQAIPLSTAEIWTTLPGLSPAMAFEFRAVDRQRSAGATFDISLKPTQVSATVHRLVNIQPGSIEQEAVIQYQVRYAPLDTFYLKMPAAMADADVQIIGANIKEKPRIDQLPADQLGAPDPNTDGVKWTYYRIVLQSALTGGYNLVVRLRQPFQAGAAGGAVPRGIPLTGTTVKVEPILAAGKLSDQNGDIAIAKAQTLAIGEPVVENLIPADPGSPADLPYASHRAIASLAFKYNAPPFALSLPVIMQKEAAVFTTMVTTTIIEQVLARDGMLNTHASFLLATSVGERLPVTLPANAELTAVLLDGSEIPVEKGLSANELIVRLPPSAGQISRFTLEISYGLKGVSPLHLPAPALAPSRQGSLLPGDIPVQQTLWRLWIPEDYCLLWHDKVFSRLSSLDSRFSILDSRKGAGAGVPSTGQGTAYNFIRQGAPGQLSVMVAGRERLSVVIWALTIAAGVVMLKLSGFHRVLVILGAALAAGVVHLFAPLFVDRILGVGVFAVILVLLLWLTHWTFRRFPRLGQSWTASRQRAAEKKIQAKAQKQDKTQTKQDQR